MMRAVRFDKYGGIDVLRVDDVPMPVPAAGEVLVKVQAAAINPGEAKIREGFFHSTWPATFPSGEGSDFSGIVMKPAAGVSQFQVGDQVFGFTDKRASHADYVVAEAQNMTRKPGSIPWDVAACLPIAGSTAYACVRAVSLKQGDAVAVSGAGGGVGSIAVQLAKRTGAKVIGIASISKHDWLVTHGVEPVVYGDGLAEALRKYRLNAFIDTHGAGYVKLATELGIPRDRINTIIDFAAAKEYGVKAEGGQTAKTAPVLSELAALVASGELDVPVAAVFPLAQVRDAYKLLEQGHTFGKIVLLSV
jgi:NADPH:quinone reductase-like Zn-dependent oxidoreductase